MMNFTLIAALLWTFNWISVSVSEFHTVEVQPGEEVTLMCSNFTSFLSHIHWYKLDNRANASLISSMLSSDTNTSFFGEFQNGKFDMTSNITTIFLKIKQVDSSDSGLYFCGFNSNGYMIADATYLKVQVFDGITKLMIVILGPIIFFVIVVICLVVKIRKLHKNTGHKEGQNPQPRENLDSDALNYAALSFHPKAKRVRRSVEDQLESNVVYAATR